MFADVPLCIDTKHRLCKHTPNQVMNGYINIKLYHLQNCLTSQHLQRKQNRISSDIFKKPDIIVKFEEVM